MQKLWGGRFDGKTDALVERLNNSLVFDGRLWRQDIQGSLAHARMLGDTGIIPAEDATVIITGLESLYSDLQAGDAVLPPDAEDVHTAVEGLLRERIGPVAGKLHTARSRNDQIATDIRLYLREASNTLDAELAELQRSLLNAAERHFETVLPGCTHMQHAQPVVLAHHLLAYFWMFDRDRERLSDGAKRINRLPLGAAALAGTSFPIDREQVCEALGFASVIENSMDAVASRDFAVEFLATASIIMLHISRLAEEIIVWNSPEFGFVTLADAVTTGSSIMPQKKNPDVAELARGKSGRVFGNLVAMLTLIKGLPLTYNKDLQEDKEPLFDAIDTLCMVLPAMRLTLDGAQFRTDRMRNATEGDFSTATDLADYLVRMGMPFREAHSVVGQLVRRCIADGKTLEKLTAEELADYVPELADRAGDVTQVLTVDSSVRSRVSRGGTAPDAVRMQWTAAKERLVSGMPIAN